MKREEQLVVFLKWPVFMTDKWLLSEGYCNADIKKYIVNTFWKK